MSPALLLVVAMVLVISLAFFCRMTLTPTVFARLKGEWMGWVSGWVGVSLWMDGRVSGWESEWVGEWVRERVGWVDVWVYT